MALKDWKKVALRSWQKYEKSSQDTYVGKWVSWNYFPKKHNPYVVDTMSMGYLTILGRFKTKSKALSFAKAYMRSH
jgi:hypothetical protein